MDVYIKGSRVRLSPTQSIGKGGEADVFDIGAGNVVKVFKAPNHPDFEGLPYEQQCARERIREHQDKLRLFPKGLSDHVVVPIDLATDQSGRTIVGYTMRFLAGAELLLHYGEKSFRQAGVKNDTIIEIFRNLHATVRGIHAHTGHVVIGDFNDLNILVAGSDAYLIDADSFQFGKFLCRVFTAKFVDPILCDPGETKPLLVRPHTPESDWYAFAVMLMQCLLYVHPFGGVYSPKDAKKRVVHDARPLKRITVFSPEVRYPKPAVPYGVLSDDMLQYFSQVFEKDKRGEFPIALLESFRWTVCIVCSTEHARGMCPGCKQTAPAALKAVVEIRGTVTASRISRTRGVILYATLQSGKLAWVAHEGGEFRREDGSTVVRGALDHQMRFRIRGPDTLVARHGQMVTIVAGGQSERTGVDSFGVLPVIDANYRTRYWIQSGTLMRDGRFGPERVGDVLEGQTLFWVGPTFGFGFYRAGNLSVSFVFRADRAGINDSIKLFPIRGQLIDATTVFTDQLCWFFTLTKDGSRRLYQCAVIKLDGTVLATSEAEEGSGSWLESFRGSCAAGNYLFTPTDDGVVRIEAIGGVIQKTKEFPDTEPFVDSESKLFPSGQGLYAVGSQEIVLLKIA